MFRYGMMNRMARSALTNATRRGFSQQSSSVGRLGVKSSVAALGCVVAYSLYNQEETKCDGESKFDYKTIGAAAVGTAVGAMIAKGLDTKGKVEEKFAKYWPRKIMILIGPPGAGKGT